MVRPIEPEAFQATYERLLSAGVDFVKPPRDPQEEADAPSDLVAHHALLVRTVGTREQDAGLGARWPDDTLCVNPGPGPAPRPPA